MVQQSDTTSKLRFDKLTIFNDGEQITRNFLQSS